MLWPLHSPETSSISNIAFPLTDQGGSPRPQAGFNIDSHQGPLFSILPCENSFLLLENKLSAFSTQVELPAAPHEIWKEEGERQAEEKEYKSPSILSQTGTTRCLRECEVSNDAGIKFDSNGLGRQLDCHLLTTRKHFILMQSPEYHYI